MRYIAYCLPTFVGDGFILEYNSIPSSKAAFNELLRIGADILGVNLTHEQCMMKVLQHSLAIDAMQCMS